MKSRSGAIKLLTEWLHMGADSQALLFRILSCQLQLKKYTQGYLLIQVVTKTLLRFC
jgi:hypothetical protein